MSPPLQENPSGTSTDSESVSLVDPAVRPDQGRHCFFSTDSIGETGDGYVGTRAGLGLQRGRTGRRLGRGASDVTSLLYARLPMTGTELWIRVEGVFVYGT